MNWHEWMEAIKLKRMNWNEWFVRLIFKKWKKPLRKLRRLCEIELSLESRAHVVDLILKKWREPVIFWRFMWNRALARVARALCRPNGRPKKWREPVSFLRFLCEIELSLQSRAHFVGHFPDRAAKLRKQTPSSGDRGQPLYPKKCRVLRPRLFSAVNSRSRSLTHDDVVEMIMEQLLVTIVCNSEVF